MRNFIYTAILLCLTSIILGAFGAHLLKEILTEFQLSSFETGVRFQMFHGLAILILSFNKKYFNDKLKFESNSLDGAYDLGAILYSYDLLYTFKEIFRVLKPGGRYLTLSPS